VSEEDTPRTAADWTRSGALHYRAGRFREAEAATREAVRLGPRDMGAWANLGAILRAQRRTLDALHVLDQALAIAPDAPTVLLNRANVLNELQRFAEALRAPTAPSPAAATTPSPTQPAVTRWWAWAEARTPSAPSGIA
jgi:Flp pilus assembly protein TadD